MIDENEAAYIMGHRMAHAEMIQKCLGELGYSDPAAQGLSWVLEREAAIARLRDLCQEFGDNDWTENLHLADIIEKHLGRHLGRECGKKT